MSVFKFNPEELIETISVEDVFSISHDKRVVAQFNEVVAGIRKLLEIKKTICAVPVSFGKDSTVTLLAVIEAYRQCLELKTIEPERPLIVSNVNTYAEAIAMQMFVSYASKRMVKYARNVGINIQYEQVGPSMNNQFFIRYVGGQKIPATPNRYGDCSVILKVDPNEKLLSQITSSYHDQQDSIYKDSPIAVCLGSRKSESTRRAKNMETQNIKSKSVEDLMAEMKPVKIGSSAVYNFAPISDWETDDVFLLLSLAGSKPLKRSAHSVNGFLADFGLLMEIYGNGSGNEVCDVVAGSSNGSGCNGKSRFGCTICTMISTTDKTATNLSKLTRWKVLGVEDTLRLRDWLYRISSSVEARALHSRAFDSVGYNRVALQANTLKPRYLEKIVRYACQLTQSSIANANSFKALLAKGEGDKHPGMQCIADDSSLAPKVKKAFLEMYSECLQDPKNLNSYFSEAHALLLSFRWSLDGIGSAPFRPLAIWRQIEKGEGWIPYPKLNAELKAGEVGKLQGYESLPEAVMMPVLKNEDAHDHVFNHTSLIDLWRRPVDTSDVFDEEMNCSINRKANKSAKVLVSFSSRVVVKPVTDGITKAKVGDVTYTLLKPIINKVVLEGKVAKGQVLEMLLAGGLLDEVIKYCQSRFESVAYSTFEPPASITDFSMCDGVFSLTRDVQYLEKQSFITGYVTEGRKVASKINFTQRVSKVDKGVLKRGNTRMVFYPLNVHSRLHEAHSQRSDMLLPNFDTHTQKVIHIHDTSLFQKEEEARENILITPESIGQFKEAGGIERAIDIHNKYMERLVKRRHLLKTKRNEVRRYSGTQALEILLAEGVVSIERKYWTQFQYLLKRTQVFDSLDMFRFQSMSVSDVINAPGAVSMSQHRKDKAKVLKLIRNHRNNERAKVVEAFNKPAEITKQLSTFESGVYSAVNTAVHQYFSSLLMLSFDSHQVPVADRAKVSLLWLAIQFDGVDSIDDLIKRLTSGQVASEIKSNPSVRMARADEATKALLKIKVELDSALNYWKSAIAALQAFNKGTYNSREDAKAVFVSMVHNSCFSNFSDAEHLLRGWNPNLEVLIGQTRKIESNMSSTIEFLQGVYHKLEHLTIRDKKRMVGSMSLSDKLALMG